MKIAWDETDLAMCPSTVSAAARRLPLEPLAEILDAVSRREGSYTIYVKKVDGKTQLEVDVDVTRYTLRAMLMFKADGESVLKIVGVTPQW